MVKQMRLKQHHEKRPAHYANGHGQSLPPPSHACHTHRRRASASCLSPTLPRGRRAFAEVNNAASGTLRRAFWVLCTCAWDTDVGKADASSKSSKVPLSQQQQQMTPQLLLATLCDIRNKPNQAGQVRSELLAEHEERMYVGNMPRGWLARWDSIARYVDVHVGDYCNK